MADQSITPEVEQILQEGTFSNEGTIFTIHSGQLDPDLYGKVDLILKLLGGKWNKSKGGHVFVRDAQATLAVALKTKTAPDLKKRRQAYYTPEETCKELVSEIFVDGHLVLEPSAGGGALARAARDAGADVHCIEIDPFEAETLESQRFKTTCANFLEVEPNPIYEAVIMNPPFTGGQDEKHVRHALKFLKPGGKLVAIVSPSFKISVMRELAARYGLNRVELHRIDAGTFKESGTNIETRKLIVRTYGDTKIPDNRDQIEWRASQLALETIHGNTGRDISIFLEKKPSAERARIKIKEKTREAAQATYRNDRGDEIGNLIVDDDLLNQIIKEAVLECLDYYEIPAEAVEPPVEKPEEPKVTKIAKPKEVVAAAIAAPTQLPKQQLNQPMLFDCMDFGCKQANKP